MEKAINQKAEYTAELNDKIVSSIVGNYVENLHQRCRTVEDNHNDDVFSSVQKLGYKISDIRSFSTLNKRLKRKSEKSTRNELMQRLLDEYSHKQQEYEKEVLNHQIKEYNLSPTPNKDFMINKEGKYYRIYDRCLFEEPEVSCVNQDGSYVVVSSVSDSSDKLVTTYNTEDKPIALKIINKAQKPYAAESYVVRKLCLKKEYVNKYKLHGYSGNSSGITATIKNFITKPVPSGYYLHESYNFYKWNYKTLQFEIDIRNGKQPGSPMMADYDIKENSVIRTDYDGVGIC